MAERFMSVNPDTLTPGKFYRVYTDKDNATLTLLKDDEDTLYSDVSTLKTTQAGLVLDVTNAKDDIVTLETDNTTNKTNISNLQSDNTTNKSDISTLKTQVQDINPTPISQCWVSTSGSDSNNGSINKPFRTIQKALNESFGVINVLSGTYTEDLTIPVVYGLYGPIIQGHGTIEAPKAEIRGTLTIPSELSRLRLKLLQFDGKDLGPAIIDNGSEGRHVIELCSINNAGSGNDLIRVVNGKNWWTVSSSSIEGTINLSGTGNTASFNIFNSPNSYICTPIVNSGYTLTLSNVAKMGLITHNAGNIFADHVSSWYPISGKIINSTSISPLDIIGVNYSVFSADAINYGVISTTGATVLKNYNIENVYEDVCLSTVSTVASTLITTTASTLIAGTKKVERNISYNTTNGELTFTKTGSYNITAVIKIDCTEWNKKVETWIEKYNTSTSSWDLVADTGMQRMFQTDQEVEINYHFASYFTAGEKYRIRAVSDSDTTISARTLTLNNGVKMPAMRISVYA